MFQKNIISEAEAAQHRPFTLLYFFLSDEATECVIKNKKCT